TRGGQPERVGVVATQRKAGQDGAEPGLIVSQAAGRGVARGEVDQLHAATDQRLQPDGEEVGRSVPGGAGGEHGGRSTKLPQGGPGRSPAESMAEGVSS